MTGGRDTERSTDSGGDGSPIDFDRLATINERLATDDRFVRTEERPEFAPARLIGVYDSRLYPSSVAGARLELVWYENGYFSHHYHETHDTGSFDHRWDRHPSTHNTRDHVHPGPDAPTPGEDASHPCDWRDVLSMVISEIDARQRGFWVDS